jgi:hypothetical protein
MELLQGEDIFETVTTTLRALNNLLPTATATVKSARLEVSKASKNMDGIFSGFEKKGPAIFNNVAYYYKLIWTAYFFFLVPLSLLMLYYAFWAGGYFGGPQPILEDASEPPATWWEQASVCCAGCCACMTKFHDTQLCLWSVVILMQVIVLLIFIVSLILCILAGAQAFIVAGCSQVYIIGDPEVCTASLENLRGLIDTFFVGNIGEDISEAICHEHNLLTCNLIADKMTTAGLYCAVFSFVGTILSLQMLIESAVLHEMARYRRLANAAKSV